MIDRYQQHLRNRHLSPITILNYSGDINIFKTWASRRLGMPTNSTPASPSSDWVYGVHAPLVRDFITYLREERGSGPGTIKRKIVSCRRFWAWMLVQEWVKRNPWDNIDSPKLGHLLPKVLSQDQMAVLLDQPKEELKRCAIAKRRYS